MMYLLQEAGKNPEFSKEKQLKFDYDPILLSQLLNLKDGRINWSGLNIIRQYTVNFNPAIKSEFRPNQVVESAMFPYIV
jgi:hypothetical protein